VTSLTKIDNKSDFRRDLIIKVISEGTEKNLHNKGGIIVS